MTAALNFRLDEDHTDFEPRVEVRPVLPPRWAGEGPLKSLYSAAIKQGVAEPGPVDPFVVIFTPSGDTPEHARRAEESAYSTSKALSSAGYPTFMHPGKRSTIEVYCIPFLGYPRLPAAESLRRMWAQLWK